MTILMFQIVKLGVFLMTNISTKQNNSWTKISTACGTLCVIEMSRLRYVSWPNSQKWLKEPERHLQGLKYVSNWDQCNKQINNRFILQEGNPKTRYRTIWPILTTEFHVAKIDPLNSIKPYRKYIWGHSHYPRNLRNQYMYGYFAVLGTEFSMTPT